MSSWQRPRSPSPSYRSRRYSPSREVSPPPSSAHGSLPPPPAQAQRYQTGEYRRDDLITRPMRSEHYSPPSSSRDSLPARHVAYSGASVDRYAPLPPSRRSRSPSPRYSGRRSPSPQRYRNTRPYSPPPTDRYRSSPPAKVGRRNRPGAADFYDEPPPSERNTYDARPGPGPGNIRSMVADREEERVRDIPPPRLPKVQDQWERGVEPPTQQVRPVPHDQHDGVS